MLKNRQWLLVSMLAVVALALAACGGAAADIAPATVQMVSAAEVERRLPEDLNDGMILLDVRTPEEWADEGHIEGATLLPLQELPDHADNVLPKDAEIVVYCRSGNRSAQAAEWLISNGYTNVSDMGGIIDWKAAGYPVEYGQ